MTQRGSYGVNGIDKKWFHGLLSASEAEALLQNQPIGTYLVRFSKSRAGSFALAFVNKDNRVAHVLIVGDSQVGFTLKETGNTNPKTFNTLQQLIDYYNYILYFPLPSDLPFQFTWFHGDMTSKEAADCLSTQKRGTFLVRLSRKGPGYYTLSYMDNGIKHSLIEAVTGGYQFQGENAVKPSIDLLIESHHHILRYPYRRLSLSNEKAQEVEQIVASIMNAKDEYVPSVTVAEDVKSMVENIVRGKFDEKYSHDEVLSLLCTEMRSPMSWRANSRRSTNFLDDVGTPTGTRRILLGGSHRRQDSSHLSSTEAMTQSNPHISHASRVAEQPSQGISQTQSTPNLPNGSRISPRPEPPQRSNRAQLPTSGSRVGRFPSKPPSRPSTSPRPKPPLGSRSPSGRRVPPKPPRLSNRVVVELVDKQTSTPVQSKEVTLDRGRIPLAELKELWGIQDPVWIDTDPHTELGVMSDGFSDCTFPTTKTVRIIDR